MECNHIEGDGTIKGLCSEDRLDFYPHYPPKYWYALVCKYCNKQLGLVDNRENRHYLYLKEQHSNLLYSIKEYYQKKDFDTEIAILTIDNNDILKEVYELNKEPNKPIQLPDVKPLSKSDEDYFKLISEINQDIKKSDKAIDQHVIINNQINKITDLETEVKRLEKIVIGLSERLINKKEVI